MIEKCGYDDFGVDLRYNMFEIDSIERDEDFAKVVKEQAKSVACLMKGSFLEKNLKEKGKGVCLFAEEVKTLDQKIKQTFRSALGEDEKFRNEPSVGLGTAFLIGKQLLFTPAHCLFGEYAKSLSESKVKDMVAVFDFQMQSQDELAPIYEENVYRIEAVVAHYKGGLDHWYDDWAILKLEKEVIGRKPLDITNSDQISDEDSIYMLGHPTGLPMKYTRKGKIEKSHEKGKYFEARIDSFVGNSGSPVFSQKDNSILGMLIAGNRDFILDKDYHGFGETKVRRAKMSDKIVADEIEKKGYEKCHKIASFHFLQSVLSSIDLSVPVIPAIGTIGTISEGLHLEADCNHCKNSVIIQRGFGSFDLSEECANSVCSNPECKQSIDFDNVNVLVLSSCDYSIEGGNTQDQVIKEGPFRLLKGKINNQNRSIRFNVQEWYYLELKVEKY